MTLEELKEIITCDMLPDELVILKCSDNHYLANQYINELCIRQQLSLHRVNSLLDIKDSSLSLIIDFEKQLNLLSVEEFNEELDSYLDLKNTFIICDKINKKIESRVKKYIIEIPKLLDWQIIDYMKVLCEGLSNENYEKLYKMTSGDIYKIENELLKIKTFDIEKRNSILATLFSDKSSDLYTITIFDLVKAIVQKDKDVLEDYMRHQSAIDYDPIAIVTLLLSTYKKAAYLFLDSNMSLEEFGMTKGQAYYFNQDYSFLRNRETQIRKNIDFLSSIDVKLKDGKLDMQRNTLLDFIICNII